MHKKKVQQHYIPRCYLDAYVDANSRNNFLYGYDLEQLKSFRKVSLEQATRRYFNDFSTIDGSKSLEDWYQVIEDTAAPILRTTIINEKLPTGQDFENLIYFVGQQFIRVPKCRGFLRRLLHRGLGTGRADDFEQMQTEEILGVLSLERRMFKEFAALNWSLCKVDNNAPELLVGDCPVVPIPNNLQSQGGFKSRDWCMPLSRRLALVGTPDLLTVGEELDERSVLILNRNSVLWAERFAFAATDDARCSLLNDRSGSVLELARTLKAIPA